MHLCISPSSLSSIKGRLFLINQTTFLSSFVTWFTISLIQKSSHTSQIWPPPHFCTCELVSSRLTCTFTSFLSSSPLDLGKSAWLFPHVPQSLAPVVAPGALRQCVDDDHPISYLTALHRTKHSSWGGEATRHGSGHHLFDKETTQLSLGH